MNTPSGNALQQIKELMRDFRSEVGGFLGLQEMDRSAINQNHEKKRYALRFERCTIDLDLITNANTNTQIVRRFDLR